jgi:murein DD-endopeptidase MepM/ murein hydrolase activator NlpD
MSEVEWPLLENVIRRRKINHTFGMVRKYANGMPKPHQGWDFEAKVGTPAYAIADGEIVLVRDSTSYGHQLTLKFEWEGQTLYAFYAHLHQYYMSQGQKVVANDIIAACGKSGNAKNLRAKDDHLHFEIRTKLWPGRGLKNRMSPLKLYKRCPLRNPIAG